MTDDEFVDTEERVRAALSQIAATHAPRPVSEMAIDEVAVPQRPASRQRWMLVAASVAVVVAGFVAFVVVRATQGDSESDPATTVVDNTEVELPATTNVDTAPETTTATTDADASGEVRFPVDTFGLNASWLMEWRDGFLASHWRNEASGRPEFAVQFSVDGAMWEPLEVSQPPGLSNPAHVTAVGDRLIVAGMLDEGSSETVGSNEVVRVASTTDLESWETQDFEVTLPATEGGDLAWITFLTPRSFAANADGWVFEIQRFFSNLDPLEYLPAEFPGDVGRGGYLLRSDDDGLQLTTTVPSGDIPAGTVYSFTWEELGVTPEQVPYLTEEIPSVETWAARWDGQPVRADTTAPTGRTVASDDGFIRWDHRIHFSADGLTWTTGAAPDPTGVIQDAFAIDDGFVAIVANQNGETDLYRLDSTGANPARVTADAPISPSLALGSGLLTSTPPERATFLRLGSHQLIPAVVEVDGYRLIETARDSTVVEIDTGDTVYFRRFREGAPTRDTNFMYTTDAFIVTDPATGDTIVEIPQAIYHAALDDASSPAESADESEPTEPDIIVLATRDGVDFLTAPFPNAEVDTVQSTDLLATTDAYVLTRSGDQWIRYDLPR